MHKKILYTFMTFMTTLDLCFFLGAKLVQIFIILSCFEMGKQWLFQHTVGYFTVLELINRNSWSFILFCQNLMPN